MTNCIACKDIEQLTVGARNDGTSKRREVTIHFDYPRCKESLLYVRLPSGITTSYNEHGSALSPPPTSPPSPPPKKKTLERGLYVHGAVTPQRVGYFLSSRPLGTLAFIKPPPSASKGKIVLTPHSTLAIVYCGKKKKKRHAPCTIHCNFQFSPFFFFLRTLGVSSV